jgi:plasmid stability protein
MDMTISKQQNSFPLRMPEEMRKRLEERAKENGRSMTAEIVAMLQQVLDSEGSNLSGVPAGILLHEVIERYGAKLQIIVAQEVAEQTGIDVNS